MPKTYPHRTRDEKAAAIIDVAERQLCDGGYHALSVAAIGRELGVAQNTIYWYFSSKDELFVATLRGMLGRIHARKPSKKAGRIEQILWFTDQFEGLSGLRAAMTERARSSAVVSEFVQEFDALLSRMLSSALSQDLPADELSVAVETFRATVEGTFARGLDRRERRRVLTYALQRLTKNEQPS